MGERRGKFITLEGIEGCGKSTQAGLLSAYLCERGVPCIQTKEPGGTPIGRLIRGILLAPEHDGMTPVCEALLYLADRAQHSCEVVQPALASGAWIVCDRYHDSTLAYQGAARGISARDLNRIFKLATGNLKPDLTIILDLDPRVGLQRAVRRNDSERLSHEGRFEAEKLQFHEAVRRSFLQMAEAEPDRFALVSAVPSQAEVATAIRDLINHRWVGSFV